MAMLKVKASSDHPASHLDGYDKFTTLVKHGTSHFGGYDDWNLGCLEMSHFGGYDNNDETSFGIREPPWWL